MFANLYESPRLLMEVPLRPIQGDRFQPTGFPDLGAAIYERPDGKRMILVESAQSMSNRLEKTCLVGDGPNIAPEFEGLPYILVQLEGEVESQTSSLVEAHRINSPFIITDKKFQDAFVKESGYKKGYPLDWKRLALTIFRFDPNSLLHGVFMANLEDGRIKMPRALSAFIEAEDCREAASGGVKHNPFDPSGTIRVINFDKDVYGNVPYHRIEYVASKLTAFFNLDLSLLKGYGLPKEAMDLLVSLGLYKIRRFLNTGLRLRTACDLMIAGEIQVKDPSGFKVPEDQELMKGVQQAISQCSQRGIFVKPPVTELKTQVKKKAKEGQVEAEG